ncbi:MAG: hypothetical protein ABIU09_09060 [Pyrinomonadaceae bacterium]
MKVFKINLKIHLGLFAALFFCFFTPQTAFCQAEKLGIVQYTPPKGWAKTPKENAVVFSESNADTGKYCIITLYGAMPGTGSGQGDFSREWANLVVKNMKAEANPPTETHAADGWTVIGGALPVEEGVAFLTVFSGFGKTVSVLGVFNEKAYIKQIETFILGIDLDKIAALTKTATVRNSGADPEAVIHTFYNGYIRSFAKGVDPFGKRSTLKKHLTARLKKEQVTTHEASQDADYFLHSPQYFAEWENNFNISKPEVTGATATAFVTFPDGYSRVKITLRKGSGVWKIDRVQNAKL